MKRSIFPDNFYKIIASGAQLWITSERAKELALFLHHASDTLTHLVDKRADTHTCSCLFTLSSTHTHTHRHTHTPHHTHSHAHTDTHTFSLTHTHARSPHTLLDVKDPLVDAQDSPLPDPLGQCVAMLLSSPDRIVISPTGIEHEKRVEREKERERERDGSVSEPFWVSLGPILKTF